MTADRKIPELSIIVPVLNEAGELSDLLDNLARQQGVDFEVVFSDGGSTDGTPQEAEQLADALPYPVRVLASERGRGRQLNAGARAARGMTLLFLHADSAFPDACALRKGLDALTDAVAARKDERVAGRFALRFRRRDETPSIGYYFYEWKAHLDRPGCTHGDQGFLLPRSFFREVGPFAESLPVLEDTLLAEAVRRQGEWLLLPAQILTSARRFEVEGLRARQTLNALIMNFAATGLEDFIREIPAVYGSQDRVRGLKLYPFFAKIRQLTRVLPRRELLRKWYATGCYVRRNAWQLAFALDARRAFRRGLPPGTGETPNLDRFDCWFDRLTDHPPGRLAAAALVWLWFHQTCRRLRQEAVPGPAVTAAKGESE